jgi:hypothetical protein
MGLIHQISWYSYVHIVDGKKYHSIQVQQGRLSFLYVTVTLCSVSTLGRNYPFNFQRKLLFTNFVQRNKLQL